MNQFASSVFFNNEGTIKVAFMDLWVISNILFSDFYGGPESSQLLLAKKNWIDLAFFSKVSAKTILTFINYAVGRDLLTVFQYMKCNFSR